MTLRGLLLLMLGLMMLGVASAQTSEAEIVLLDWRMTFLWQGVDGRALLLPLPGDGWRLAMARGRVETGTLLQEAGEGWTAVGNTEGRVWLNGWGEPSRELADSQAQVLQSLVESLVEPTSPLQRISLTPMSGERWDAPVVELPVAGGLRQALAARASGRGDARETLMVRPCTVDGDGGARITSRRRHGLLLVQSRSRWPVLCDPADALLPIWPLAELVTATGPE